MNCLCTNMFRASAHCSVHGPKTRKGYVILNRVKCFWHIRNDGLWLMENDQVRHFNEYSFETKADIIRQVWRSNEPTAVIMGATLGNGVDKILEKK